MPDPLAKQTSEWTRLAPSPTGALHLGNLRTFIINWVLARQRGWKILLRIDDLDGPRKKLNADQQAIATLQWIGLDWDAGPEYESEHREQYDAALAKLIGGNQVYACNCSRREIELAALSAPHEDETPQGELRYPGTCRNKAQDDANENGGVASHRKAAQDRGWRLRVPDAPVEFFDQLQGRQVFDVQQQVGDFLVFTRCGEPSYQLAVVVDDHRAGITQVVRGDDLLSSTARQLCVYRQLGLRPAPSYWHLPLVVGGDGRRLAKRHGDTRVTTLQEAGVSKERLLGWAGNCSGLKNSGQLTLQNWLEDFDIQQVPREPVVWEGDQLF